MFNFQTRRVNGGKIFRNNISVKREKNKHKVVGTNRKVKVI